jgi:FkbM family methyltransferase
MSHPIVQAVYAATHRQIFDPTRIVKEFQCKNEYGLYMCPGRRCDIQFSHKWEARVKAFVSELNEGLFVDIGANFGFYTIMASKILNDNGKVLSVEADPLYYSFLCQNIELNSCRNTSAKNVAAWSENGKVSIFPYRFGVSSEDSSTTGQGPYIEVEAKPMDEILDGRTPALTKIDVEGAEYEVMEGMASTLSKEKNMAIIFESLTEKTFRPCSRFLKGFGFSVMPLEKNEFLARASR